MRIIDKAILQNVIIFDRKELSVKGLAKKNNCVFELSDFIVKDRNKVMNAALVLYDDSKCIKFVRSNIGKNIESYDVYNKHIRDINETQIKDLKGAREIILSYRKQISSSEELDEEDDLVDVDATIISKGK
jgi:hypothetical protein